VAARRSIRAGDADDPLGGVVHILLPDQTDVEVVIAKCKWEARLIEPAEPMPMGGVTITVPRLGDLILLKLAEGGYLDLRDAAALLAIGDRPAVVAEVEAHIHEVTPDIRPAWLELLASVER
jgi:hypothetical protein